MITPLWINSHSLASLCALLMYNFLLERPPHSYLSCLSTFSFTYCVFSPKLPTFNLNALFEGKGLVCVKLTVATPYTGVMSE